VSLRHSGCGACRAAPAPPQDHPSRSDHPSGCQFKGSFRPIPQSWSPEFWGLFVGMLWSTPRGMPTVGHRARDPAHRIPSRCSPAPAASQSAAPKGLRGAIMGCAVTGVHFPGAPQECVEITPVSQTASAARHAWCEERKHLPKVSRAGAGSPVSPTSVRVSARGQL